MITCLLTPVHFLAVLLSEKRCPADVHLCQVLNVGRLLKKTKQQQQQQKQKSLKSISDTLIIQILPTIQEEND